MDSPDTTTDSGAIQLKLCDATRLVGGNNRLRHCTLTKHHEAELHGPLAHSDGEVSWFTVAYRNG